MNTTLLDQEKRILLAQCDLDRARLSAAVTELEARTGWAQLGAAVAMFAVPKLKLAIPVLGVILPYILPGGSSSSGSKSKSGLLSSIGTGVRVALKLGQKAAILGQGVRLISSRLKHS